MLVEPKMKIPLGVFLACLSAQAGTLSLNPLVVEAGRGSVVTVSGHSDVCAPIVTHAQATVAGSILKLTAAFEPNPAALCMPGPIPFATDFALPAMDSGAYTVLLRILPACSYSPTPCPFAVPMPDTGKLYVQDPATSHYHIDPDRTEPGQVPRVKLTAPEFLCGSGFDSLSVDVQGRRIILGFEHIPHPQALCPGGPGSGGPVFDLSGLAPGTYQVFAGPKEICDRGLCQIVPGPNTFAGAYIADDLSDRRLWVTPRKVAAGSPTTISLGGTGFSCKDSLTEKRAEVKDGAILLHFNLTRTTTPSLRCMVDTIFVGNAPFSLSAISSGTYPVILAPEDCAFASPLCATDLSARTVDTVAASVSLGLHPGDNPAGKKAGARGLGASGSARGVVPWQGRKVDYSGRAIEALSEPR